MKQLRTTLWLGSWLLTVPITVLFLYWGIHTVERWNQFYIKRTGLDSFQIHDVGVMEWRRMMHQARVSLRAHQPLPLDNIRNISLVIPESGLAQLNRNLPLSGREYVKGGLLDHGTLQRVKIRYRGDTVSHWGYPKKSLRVKTRKSQLFEGMRSFNLIAPNSVEILNNYLSFRLAQSLGIVAPKVEMVNVTINGKNDGIHMLLEQLDESTLRRHRRMPGDIYSGEMVRRDRHTGILNQVFEAPGAWEKQAVNNHYPDTSIKPLRILTELLKTPYSKASQEQLSQILDLDAFARMSALVLLTESFHMDVRHNWRLYYDPARSMFEPMVWDLLGWYYTYRPPSGQTPRLDSLDSPLDLALHLNGDFVRARSAIISDFFESEGDQHFFSEMTDTVDALLPLIERDPLHDIQVQHLSYAQTKAAIADLRQEITRTFSGIKKGYLDNPGKARLAPLPTPGSYALEVTGRQPIQALSFQFDGPVAPIVGAYIRLKNAHGIQEINISDALRQQHNRIEIHVPLLSQQDLVVDNKRQDSINANNISRRRQNHLAIQPAYYEVVLTGLPQSVTLRTVSASLDGTRFTPIEQVAKIPASGFKTMHNIVHPQPVSAPHIWQGDITLTGMTELDQELILKPGTTVHMAPGASLILNNRLIAEGTASAPVRFVAADPGQDPWGTVVLKGPGANGSRLSHCEFAGGSGLKGDLFEYSAMFSVHDVQGVSVSHCTFRDSKIVDDMVHAVYSDIKFTDSSFIRSLSDAVDLDISHGVFERCRFIDSGNDAVDLMTTEAAILDSTFERSGDKGVSVGESSHLLAINSRFLGSQIAVQAKDGSVAVLYNTDLIGNHQALDAYKKNWRYDAGGKIFVYNSVIQRSDTPIHADKRSKIRIYDSYVAADQEIGKRVKLAADVDRAPQLEAASTAFERTGAEKKAFGDPFPNLWQRVDPARRGAQLATR